MLLSHNFNGIIFKLKQNDISRDLLNLLPYLLRNRKQRVVPGSNLKHQEYLTSLETLITEKCPILTKRGNFYKEGYLKFYHLLFKPFLGFHNKNNLLLTSH